MRVEEVSEKPMTEKQFQNIVLGLCSLYGWRSAHFGNSIKYVRRGNSYITIPDKQAAGFPDIVAVRGDRVIFAELKRDKGQVTKVQQEWLDDLVTAKMEVYLWRPRDLEEVKRVLQK